MLEIVTAFLGWYLTTQIVGFAAMPLTLRYFSSLPDRGYAFARVLGIFLVSLVLWLGTSYGLLRNLPGGAWVSLLIIGLLSLWAVLQSEGVREEGPILRLRSLLRFAPSPAYALTVEILFLVAFAVWTYVRAYDPAINHTEQPMDLMFLNGIWSSPSYPPRDPWLAGFAISYYYFGYWMLSTLAHLAGQPPEIAYNLGQACWFGLLVTACFGVGYNLYRLRLLEFGADSETGGTTDRAEDKGRTVGVLAALPFIAGLLTSTAVALTSNLHVILEWLYAQGVRIDGLARFVDVHGFPERSSVTGHWYIDSGWSWWWRASRVIEDVDLSGNHIEIIDEFPIFSYVLSDNHPHLLAMPFVLLVIGMALNWYKAAEPEVADSAADQEQIVEEATGWWAAFSTKMDSYFSAIARPIGPARLSLLIAATGGLLFLNTWDFPPYWLLLILVAMLTGTRRSRDASGALHQVLTRGSITASAVVVGALLLYLPYFLTAQSQAGGVLPNLLHPTRLPQFLLMFGHFLLAGAGLLFLGWREQRPSAAVLGVAAALVIGLPVVFLITSGLLSAYGSGATGAAAGETDGLLTSMVERRLGHPWTFLLLGGLTTLSVGLLWRRLTDPGHASRATTFVLSLFAIACLLTYMPEFAYLRDNFGNRMNTVFKFYYQSWLLLGIAAAFAIALHIELVVRRFQPDGEATATAPVLGFVPPALSLLLILACLIYPVAGAYAKVKSFGTREPTLNGLDYVGADELAVIDWIRSNTLPESVILEAKGGSYRISSARISAATGRATLLGWDGHEAQWRGRAYSRMAEGRAQAIQEVYRSPRPTTLQETLNRWKIDYVIVGPEERAQYGVTPALEGRIEQLLDLAFEQGGFRIYSAMGASER
ncbi:MAG: DUF2298 domain-containing protein [Caldilineaceae bacterium]|nr:DUF2298 domain-containing protein [Caldilineaceae bacterium]MDE0337182.1 DUF2298 domain-containing protein [Caldilineaceae bacterium]